MHKKGAAFLADITAWRFCAAVSDKAIYVMLKIYIPLIVKTL